MVWTAPMTAVSGDLLTAAEYNLNVRDDFLETAPNLAVNPGGMWQVTATNRIIERNAVSSLITNEDSIPTEQTNYGEIKTAGPLVTTTTGTSALVFLSCEMSGQLNTQCSVSFEVSGSTVIKASDSWRLVHDGKTANNFVRHGSSRRVTLNAGSNTFRMKYRTGGLGPFKFRNREIVVIPL